MAKDDWMCAIAEVGDVIVAQDPALARLIGWQRAITRAESGWFWSGARGFNYFLLEEWLRDERIRIEHTRTKTAKATPVSVHDIAHSAPYLD